MPREQSATGEQNDKVETFAEFEARMAAEQAAEGSSAQDVTPTHVRMMQEQGTDSEDEPKDEDDETDGEDEDETAGAEDETTGAEDETTGEAGDPADESQLDETERLKRRAARLQRKLEKSREEADELRRAQSQPQPQQPQSEAADDDDDEPPAPREIPGFKEKAPKADDFEYGEMDSEYVKAVARYEGRKAFFEAKAEADQAAENQRQEEARNEARRSFGRLVSTGAAEIDDFEDVVIKNANGYKLSKDFLDLAIGDKGVGHKVLYHVAKNPAEAERIARLTPAQQGVEFSKLVSRFSPPTREKSDAPAAGQQQQRTATKAPNPPARRSRGSATPKKNASTMNFAEFEALVSAEAAGQKR